MADEATNVWDDVPEWGGGVGARRGSLTSFRSRAGRLAVFRIPDAVEHGGPE